MFRRSSFYLDILIDCSTRNLSFLLNYTEIRLLTSKNLQVTELHLFRDVYLMLQKIMSQGIPKLTRYHSLTPFGSRIRALFKKLQETNTKGSPPLFTRPDLQGKKVMRMETN